MNYVVVIKELSSGSIDRTITPYEDDNTAFRKFHEAFNTIGGGPKRITALLLADTITVTSETTITGETNITKMLSTDVIKNETWSEKIDSDMSV